MVQLCAKNALSLHQCFSPFGSGSEEPWHPPGPSLLLKCSANHWNYILFISNHLWLNNQSVSLITDKYYGRKRTNAGLLFHHVAAPAPLTPCSAICRGRGCNLSHVRSFTCHHHRLVSSPERAVSAWQLTSTCHPSRGRERKAETGSSQTAREDSGEKERSSLPGRQARAAETGPGRGQDKKKKKTHLWIFITRGHRRAPHIN